MAVPFALAVETLQSDNVFVRTADASTDMGICRISHQDVSAGRGGGGGEEALLTVISAFLKSRSMSALNFLIMASASSRACLMRAVFSAVPTRQGRGRGRPVS